MNATTLSDALTFGSICSGIEAASAAWLPLGFRCVFMSEIEAFQMDTQQFLLRSCARCGQVKPLGLFHKQPRGPMGRHSWCKVCANLAQKASREKNGRPPAKRSWNLATRYRLTPVQVDQMLMKQDGLCAICRGPMARMVIDHDHATKKVRGLLCHPCNVSLPAVENQRFREAALAYLTITL